MKKTSSYSAVPSLRALEGLTRQVSGWAKDNALTDPLTGSWGAQLTLQIGPFPGLWKADATGITPDQVQKTWRASSQHRAVPKDGATAFTHVPYYVTNLTWGPLRSQLVHSQPSLSQNRLWTVLGRLRAGPMTLPGHRQGKKGRASWGQLEPLRGIPALGRPAAHFLAEEMKATKGDRLLVRRADTGLTIESDNHQTTLLLPYRKLYNYKKTLTISSPYELIKAGHSLDGLIDQLLIEENPSKPILPTIEQIKDWIGEAKYAIRTNNPSIPFTGEPGLIMEIVLNAAYPPDVRMFGIIDHQEVYLWGDRSMQLPFSQVVTAAIHDELPRNAAKIILAECQRRIE